MGCVKEIIRCMMEKPDMSDQTSLDYALHAKNMQTNRKGFPPFQKVNGMNQRIQGIITGNLSSLRSSFISPDFRNI